MSKMARDFLVGLAVLVTYGLLSAAATAYLGAQKQAQLAHAKLSPAQTWLAGL